MFYVGMIKCMKTVCLTLCIQCGLGWSSKAQMKLQVNYQNCLLRYVGIFYNAVLLFFEVVIYRIDI